MYRRREDGSVYFMVGKVSSLLPGEVVVGEQDFVSYQVQLYDVKLEKMEARRKVILSARQEVADALGISLAKINIALGE